MNKNQNAFEQIGISEKKLIELISNELEEYLNSSKNDLKLSSNTSRYPLIPVGISNRHIHLTTDTFHLLFGENIEFEKMRPLYQPGEFASKHTLTIVGPKMRSITGVRILGPLRKYDQVEVSLTDSIVLGINPPIANSGSLNEAFPLTLIGPAASVYLKNCAIIANRHIHMTENDALQFGLKNGDYCKVRIGSEKGTVFENVLIRTNNNWKLQIHLDTDDANAAFLKDGEYAEFISKM